MSHDLQELFRVRMPGRREGRGVMVLDEAHNWMNSRLWKDTDRLELVRFFSQHRKLGWDVPDQPGRQQHRPPGAHAL
ncbi:MAG: zonular occludens toxin domain-containing protein [Solirubrobacteraceae bacterium]